MLKNPDTREDQVNISVQNNVTDGTGTLQFYQAKRESKKAETGLINHQVQLFERILLAKEKTKKLSVG